MVQKPFNLNFLFIFIMEVLFMECYDLTIADLKKAGECITDDMSIGVLMEIAEILVNGDAE